MRAVTVLPARGWDSAREIDQVVLDFDRRHRRRIMLRTQAGHDLLLDLPEATRLREGDGLALTSGEVVRVRAQPERLAEVHAHDPGDLICIAWHLGNRHLAMQLVGDRIRIRADHVIEEMVEGLDGHVEHIEAPFDPEAGAYAAEGHGHHHHDDHDHDA